MNLHGIVRGALTAVNPDINASLQVSTGFSLAPTGPGRQQPSYAAPVTVRAQVQPMSTKDLRMVDGLNLQGTLRSMYLFGAVDVIVRVSAKGGDLITIASGVNAGVWLTVMSAEAWPDWCKVICVLQDGS